MYMNEFLVNSLGSIVLGACYVGYKVLRNRCKSKCTENGIDIHIGILGEQISQKLDEQRKQMMTDLMDKMNDKVSDKIQVKRSPRMSAATAPSIEEDAKSIDI